MAPLIPYMPPQVVKQLLEEMGCHLQEDTEEPTEPAPDPYQDPKVREALEMVRLRQNDPGAQSILDPMFRDRRSCTPAGIGRTGHCNVSVYDTGVTMRGKTDITGVPFRDRIVHQALEKRSGWVDLRLDDTGVQRDLPQVRLFPVG